MTNTPLVEVKSLVKRFPLKAGVFSRTVGAVHAVEDVSFTIPRGATLSLVGESGSGKSTLLNILGGLDSPTAGRVQVGKRDLVNISPRDLGTYRRRDVGFVWQQTGRIVSAVSSSGWVQRIPNGHGVRSSSEPRYLSSPWTSIWICS